MNLVQDSVLGVVVMMVLEMLATYMLITFLVEPYKSTRRVYSYPYFTEEQYKIGEADELPKFTS